MKNSSAIRQKIIEQAYKDFNERNAEAVLLQMDKDVLWPNGWEGGYVKGYSEVKEYWTRQWKSINPLVIPVSFKENINGSLEVKVHQIVKDLQGKIISDTIIFHVYVFENDKIKSMEIKKP